MIPLSYDPAVIAHCVSALRHPPLYRLRYNSSSSPTFAHIFGRSRLHASIRCDEPRRDLGRGAPGTPRKGQARPLSCERCLTRVPSCQKQPRSTSNSRLTYIFFPPRTLKSPMFPRARRAHQGARRGETNRREKLAGPSKVGAPREGPRCMRQPRTLSPTKVQARNPGPFPWRYAIAAATCATS
jgi:hypothetical protein